jgi:uncharacterized protein YdeI (YjbR/CyaY-like superfamily)
MLNIIDQWIPSFVVVVRDGLKKNIIIHQRMIIPDELEVELEDTKGVIRKYC